ncbi:MAG: efflux RND transporter permease subunit [Planctomycetota bacterium]
MSRDGLLIRASLHRPVTVLMLLSTLGVVGLLANRGIPLQLVPSGLTMMHISISIPVPDSTPLEVMEEVTRPAEELFRTIPGITRISSRSGSNGAGIHVQYGASEDGDSIYADLRDRLERLLPTLPEGADRYFIYRANLDTDIPVMSVAVTYGEDLPDVDPLLENVIQPRLEAIDGVARVQIWGIVRREVEIELIPERVEAYRIDLMRLIGRLRADNLIAPAGLLREGGKRYLLRLSSRFNALEELRRYPINDSLLLADIARVDWRRGARDFLVRVDGKLCKVIELSKESDANTVDVCRRLDQALEAELKIPVALCLAGLAFHTYWDQGEAISDSVDALKTTCLWGGLLAVLVLLAFLRRALITLLVAAAIPLSLLIAVVVIFFRGGSFNVFSLTGLTISIGMLIDNAIVVGENIFRHRQLGVGPREAAEHGVGEVALAVTLATLTTVAVFLPLIYLGDDSNMRLILEELGLPVCYSLIASLAVALVFIPVATTYVRGRRRGGGGEAGVEGAIAGGSPLLTGIYRRSLAWTLRHRFAAILLALLVLYSTVVPFEGVKASGEEDERVGRVFIEIECPPFFTLSEADETVERIRLCFEPMRDEAGIETIACWFGERGGTMGFFLRPEVRVQRDEFLKALKGLAPEMPGIRISFGRETDEATDKRTRVDASGRDPRILATILAELTEQLRLHPEVLEVTSAADQAPDEIQIEVERERAQRFRVSPAGVSSLVGWALRGAPLPDLETPDEELPLWIRYQGSDMKNIGDLYRVPVYNAAGQAIPLVNLADFSVAKALPTIRRRDGRVSSSLSLLADPDADLFRLERQIQGLIAVTELPDGYELSIRGRREEFERDLSDVLQAGLMGMLLIFVLMGVLFESFLLPLSVLFSVPYMFVGSFWLMHALGQSFEGTSLVGFIILLGIVVNNAIVLIDCANRYRRGAARDEAILRAGEARLRPILMTACTTIVGLAPLVLFPQQGSGLNYRPLGIVVMGGLAASTIFTLLVVPLFYTLVDDLRSALLRGMGGFRRRRGSAR